MSDSKAIVQSSLNSAVSQNMVSAPVAKVVLEELDDLAIAGCQGVNVDDIDSEEATLVAVMIDGSGSMDKYRQAVVDGYNDVFLASMKGAKGSKSIYVSTWIFADKGGGDKLRLVHGYTSIPDCPKLTLNDYQPDGQTPLNDAAMHGLTGLLSYGQVLRDSGTRTKCIVVVLTDGEENSSRTSAVKVRTLSEDLLKQEIYVLSYVYFSLDQDEGRRNAQAEINAKKIGFPPQHMLTAGLDLSTIRRIWGQVSASIISASQTVVSANSLSVNQFFLQGR